MSEWIKIKDREPEDGQEVIYFFEVCGIFRGKYAKLMMADEDPEVWGEEFIAEAKEKGWYSNCFYSNRGWLTDDVTHWMPDRPGDLPEPPEDEYVRGVTLNGRPVKRV